MEKKEYAHYRCWVDENNCIVKREECKLNISEEIMRADEINEEGNEVYRLRIMPFCVYVPRPGENFDKERELATKHPDEKAYSVGDKKINTAAQVLTGIYLSLKSFGKSPWNSIKHEELLKALELVMFILMRLEMRSEERKKNKKEAKATVDDLFKKLNLKTTDEK